MISVTSVVRLAAFALVVSLSSLDCVKAADGFPFGMEMTLDAARLPGSKRVPDLDIGDHGEVVLELWCKGGKGQFSVAGNTVIFVAGPDRGSRLPGEQGAGRRRSDRSAERSRDLEAAGRHVSFIGARTLRFRINTN